ncbi:putative ATPase/DNA helicase [Wickerhamomyces ciferrii]|uniref:DNA repair protein RAD5 n=1 Tax=Wickerhamomyces ciferrii (strain ATCC 14091 / BCRC 22168 / CBS 111 / JCM 3599 / NBRC 0793 / NRRL Y-1031 F-60-10) TaxID=1206466 RepID=K0KX46_WICCF|nr:putative ATPase/DNA helicase [Wickerhamomyces ciferrii]CCH46059.1 putative ATPase/DNA helicase [Wickerhamomyces ciferrii]
MSQERETSRFFDTSMESSTTQVKSEPLDPIEHHHDFIRQNSILKESSNAANSMSSPVTDKSTTAPDTTATDGNVKLGTGQNLFVANDEDDEDVNEEDDAYMIFESQLQAIIQGISPPEVQKLFETHKDKETPVISAVNAYYDGIVFDPSPPKQPTTSSPLRSSPNYSQSSTQPSIFSSLGSRSTQGTATKRRKPSYNIQQKELSPTISWRRFIGSLQVVGWATRPTVRPIPYGTQLTIAKNTTQNTNKKRRVGSGSASTVSYIKLVQDYNDPSRAKEIGRVPEDIAAILFPLVDQDICDFDVTVVLCDGRLSTGDSFIVQLDCYLTSKIFEKWADQASFEEGLKQLKQKQHSFNNVQFESEAEKAIRQRQVGLFKLFNKLDYQVRTADGANDDDEEDEVIDLEDEESSDNIQPTQYPDQKPADELNLNQLKEFYRITQTSDVLATLPETETFDNFKFELRPYQKQGLTWMLRGEREIVNDQQDEQMNPLWKEFKWPKDRSWAVMRNEDLRKNYDQKCFYANLYSGEFSLEKPILKTLCRGGILADEMGLGKTVSTLALVHNAPFDKDYDASLAIKERYAFKTTLIVVPTSLLSQWQDEFLKANNTDSKIIIYYGTESGKDLKNELCGENPPMVVLTTYGTIQHEWSKLVSYVKVEGGELPKLGLFSVRFFRVVLDEGHNIRNRMAKTTKACYDLQSSRKWLLTGTPIVNRLDDLFALIKFLELQPWSNISYWKTFVTVPFEIKNYKQALDVVQSILEPILLRRTKNMKKDGKALVELPPKEVVIERIKFSPKEKALYDWFLARASSSVRASIAKGDLLKRYTTILVHILRLRQICCHMDLINGGSDEMDEDLSSKQVTNIDIPDDLKKMTETFNPRDVGEIFNNIYKKFENIEDLECSICTNQPIPTDQLSFTECGHPFCISCILEHCDYQEMKGNETLCPNCRHQISSSKLVKARKNELSITKNKFELSVFDNSLKSSKLNALLTHLRIIRDQTANEKVVVFSQFSTFLDIMERELQLEKGLTVFKFDGRLSLNSRSNILKEFKEPRQGVTVLLLSLKAGGVGLNLTHASRAFMCDPWWSPSIEDQAIDRIHRIGQESNVKVVRFIMEGSIEEKMLKIQERKRTIGEAVEAEEEERRRRRVEEIETLFEAT